MWEEVEILSHTTHTLHMYFFVEKLCGKEIKKQKTTTIITTCMKEVSEQKGPDWSWQYKKKQDFFLNHGKKKDVAANTHTHTHKPCNFPFPVCWSPWNPQFTTSILQHGFSHLKKKRKKKSFFCVWCVVGEGGWKKRKQQQSARARLMVDLLFFQYCNKA